MYIYIYVYMCVYVYTYIYICILYIYIYVYISIFHLFIYAYVCVNMHRQSHHVRTRTQLHFSSLGKSSLYEASRCFSLLTVLWLTTSGFSMALGSGTSYLCRFQRPLSMYPQSCPALWAPSLFTHFGRGAQHLWHRRSVQVQFKQPLISQVMLLFQGPWRSQRVS